MLLIFRKVSGSCSFDTLMRFREATEESEEASPVCIFSVTDAGPLRSNWTTWLGIEKKLTYFKPKHHSSVIDGHPIKKYLCPDMNQCEKH